MVILWPTCTLFQFEHGNGTDLVTTQDFVLNVPCPFRTMWKTKEIFINHDLANTSSNYEHYIAYLKFLPKRLQITRTKNN